jgi:hypothetical protein
MSNIRLMACSGAVGALARYGRFGSGDSDVIEDVHGVATLNAARKAAERPAAMTYTYCKYPNCKRG